MQAATTWNLADDKNMIIITNDNDEREHIYLPRFDMSILAPIPSKYTLNPEQNRIFTEIINTKKGKQILNQLKNAKSNYIVNSFVKAIGRSFIKDEEEREDNNKKTIKNVIKEIIEIPLTNVTHVKNTTIGLGKVEIWGAFIKAGLVKIN